MKQWTNKWTVSKYGYVDNFCCPKKKVKKRCHPLEKIGDHNLKRLPATSLERMLENRNYKQDVMIKNEMNGSLTIACELFG